MPVTVALKNDWMIVKEPAPGTNVVTDSRQIGEYEVVEVVGGSSYSAGDRILVHFPDLLHGFGKIAVKESVVIAVVTA